MTTLRASLSVHRALIVVFVGLLLALVAFPSSGGAGGPGVLVSACSSPRRFRPARRGRAAVVLAGKITLVVLVSRVATAIIVLGERMPKDLAPFITVLTSPCRLGTMLRRTSAVPLRCFRVEIGTVVVACGGMFRCLLVMMCGGLVMKRRTFVAVHLFVAMATACRFVCLTSAPPMGGRRVIGIFTASLISMVGHGSSSVSGPSLVPR